ncbi:TPA: hypothetical protein N0F65_002550 [Lagenidium giganteum]|uniref:Uncharacterized protein n=1 Tax=Lagenidium giganteum TaxID=4803 RepID=A0AAV2YDZ5_9STRA|nr:TPA: hypothetical protein N0F65_002550 [Lagenidium giganteum]
MKNHPDFLWFLVGRPSIDNVMPINMKYIRELLDASVTLTSRRQRRLLRQL